MLAVQLTDNNFTFYTVSAATGIDTKEHDAGKVFLTDITTEWLPEYQLIL